VAIPGTIMFTLAGMTGQFILNGLDGWRVQYVLEHQDTWTPKGETKDDVARDRAEEFERRFGFLGGVKKIRKPKMEERIKLLRGEIDKVDGMLKKVDDEIAALEGKESNTR
jgi:hypothetical protein